ncbi:hypothetical protein CTAYLR_008900 [Chrysophaeum taylorii]|uniref:DUF1275 domain protein n=1 Tax=Chrysophaeum taylorii TaxID=2483200 RepID=A0AAD7XKX3_9STRA|nr:hypothetical protein CTAYLR_008900 [Chrysophaeum taylorii]
MDSNRTWSIRTSSISAPSKKRVLVNGLAFTIGWSNVLCLLQYTTFGTMLTGNSIYWAQALAERRFSDAGFYASVIGAFCVGQTTFRFVDARRGPGAATAVSPVVFALALAQDALDFAFPASDRWHVLLLSTILGIVCALANDVDGTVVNMVTGHIQRTAAALFDLFGLGRRDAETLESLKDSSAVFLSFFLGVCCGTLAVERGLYRRHDTFAPAFTPLGLAFASLLCLHDRHVRARLAHTCAATAPLDVTARALSFALKAADNIRHALTSSFHPSRNGIDSRRRHIPTHQGSTAPSSDPPVRDSSPDVFPASSSS